MAWDKGDITMDITSQVHAKRLAKTGEAHSKHATNSNSVKQANELKNILENKGNNAQAWKSLALTPAEKQEVNDKSKMSSADEVSVNLAEQVQATRRTDSIAFDRSDTSVREKNSTGAEHLGEIRETRVEQEDKMEMLKGNTPFFSRIKASMGASMRQSESTDGAGGGYSNRAASGLGGYEESVTTTAEVDQDHSNNPLGAKARVEGIEEDRPIETTPGQPESGVGTTIDKML